MLQTLEQLREFRRKACITPAKPKVDLCQWKKRRLANQHCNKLTGPCVFGCALPSTSSSARVRWHKVPSPSPWPGIDSGSPLCSKCYSWGIGNPRAAVRAAARKRPLPRVGDAMSRSLTVGKQVELQNLRNHPEPNGMKAIVTIPPDDAERVTVELGQRLLRLKADNALLIDATTSDNRQMGNKRARAR